MNFLYGARRVGIMVGVLLVLVAAVARSQQNDIHISAIDPTRGVLTAGITIQSAARAGIASTLVVWGGTTQTTGFAWEILLWMQVVRYGAPIGEPKPLTNIAHARPQDVVSVLGLDDRFLVLWNDARQGAPGVYAQYVGLEGELLGEEMLFTPIAKLEADTSVWLAREGDGYRLMWMEQTADRPAYYRVRLNSEGAISGLRQKLHSIDFDNDLTYADLRGVVITRGDPVIFRHADGRHDPRPIPPERFNRPHYLSADTSFAMLAEEDSGKLVLELYASLFDELPQRRIPVPVDPQRERIRNMGAIGRDSLGRYVVTIMTQGFQPLYTYLGLYRHRLDGDSMTPPQWLFETCAGGNGMTLAYSFSTSFSNFRYQPCDDNTSRFLVHKYETWTQRVGPDRKTTTSESECETLLDRYGNTLKVDPALLEAKLLDRRYRPALRRVEHRDSSVVEISSGGGDVRLAALLGRYVYNPQRSTPGLALRNGEIVVAWREAADIALFRQARFFSGQGDELLPLAPLITDTIPDGVNGNEHHLTQSELIVLPGHALIRNQWDDERTVANKNVRTWAFRIFLPGASGWDDRSIAYERKNEVFSRERYAFDPNTGKVLVLLEKSGSRDSSSVHLFSPDGGILWEKIIQAISVNAVIPTGPASCLSVIGTKVLDGDSRLVTTLSDAEGTADAQYQRLFGERFLRYYPVAGEGMPNSPPRMRLELYDLDGRLLSQETIAAPQVQPLGGPKSRFYPLIVQRPADSSFHILWPGYSGLWLQVLDRDLAISKEWRRISATGGEVGKPAALFRGDSLFVVWEDYRPDGEHIHGVPDIYGTVVLPGKLAPGGSPADRAAIRRITPNPAHSDVSLEIRIERAGPVIIEFIDNAGKVVRSVDQGWFARGVWTLSESIVSLAPGSYFVRIRSGDEEGETARLVIVR